jgi:hypothetical protein
VLPVLEDKNRCDKEVLIIDLKRMQTKGLNRQKIMISTHRLVEEMEEMMT